MKYEKSFMNIIIYSELSNLNVKFRKNFIAIFSKISKRFFCLRMILDNAFLHLRDRTLCAFIL